MKMDAEAVLVSFKLKGSQKSDEASGILFNKNLVLLTGTTLIPLLHIPEQRKWMTSFVKSTSSKLEPNKHIHKVLFRVYRDVTNRSETNKVTDTKLLPLESKAVGVWKCALVTHSLEKLFYDWTLGRVDDSNESSVPFSDNFEMSKELMSIFILLKCEGATESETKPDSGIRALMNLMSSSVEPNRGQEVEVVSTPFGNKLFLNSLSVGVISNVIGSEKCLVLTDARTVSGCEGGPMFSAKRSRNGKKEKGNLFGVVTCPLSCWKGEWIGLTIGISLVPVLKALLQPEVLVSFPPVAVSSTKWNSDSSTLQLVDDTVVLIRNGSAWASGLVLDAASGIIITCSHAVKNGQGVSVFYKRQHHPAVILFRSRDDFAYDLAVVQTTGYSVFEKEIEFSERPAEIGEEVIAAGFPFFSEEDDFNLLPSLVCGCVARVNPFMIQTTCCIQSGFSGGPLLRDGKLLGIIVSNAKEANAGALFPHINFIIPSSVFQGPVLNYIKTKDIRSLECLESCDPKVQSIWALQTSKL